MKSKCIGLAIVLAVAFVLPVMGAGRSEAAGPAQVITMRLGHGGTTSDLRQEASLVFKEVVERETDGRATVEIFPDSTLGDWREMQEGLQIGTTDLVIEDIGTLERYSRMAALGFLPYVYVSKDHYMRVWDSDVKDVLVNAFQEETGFLLLGNMFRGARILTASRPVRQLADVRGLKIRVPGADSAIAGWQALGANPQAMAFPEVFGALQQRVIDAQENPLNVIVNNSLFEVAPYITFSNHVYGAFNFQLWGETFDSWPADVQRAVRLGAEEASAHYNSVHEDSERQFVQRLETSPGVELIYLSADEISRWADAVQPVHATYSELSDFLAAVQAAR